MNISARADREYVVLQNILQASRASPGTLKQRDLAHIAGISLGMTNTVLKRFARKGWVIVRQINRRNIQYVISPAGVEEFARRSYRFLRRTVRDIVAYRTALDGFVRELRRRGFRGVQLVGKSDLDFIVEHACESCGMRFVRTEKVRSDDRHFALYSEAQAPGGGEAGRRTGGREAYLKDVLMGLQSDHFGRPGSIASAGRESSPKEPAAGVGRARKGSDPQFRNQEQNS